MSASSAVRRATRPRAARRLRAAARPRRRRPSRSIVATDARSTRGIGDPPVEVGRELGVLSLDEVEDELTVSLRAGETRVYDPERLTTAREQRPRDLAHDALVDRRVADDALSAPRRGRPRTAASRARAPASRAPRARAPAAAPSLTEMNDTSHVTSCGANGSSVERSRVRRARARSRAGRRGSVE